MKALTVTLAGLVVLVAFIWLLARVGIIETFEHESRPAPDPVADSTSTYLLSIAGILGLAAIVVGLVLLGLRVLARWRRLGSRDPDNP